MSELPKAQIEKLLKEFSGMRVSAEAVVELLEHLEETAISTGNTAADLAATSRRKTVTQDDVKLAVKGNL